MELHLAEEIGRGQLRPEKVLVPLLAAGISIKSVADAVQDGGLAGAGDSVDEEEGVVAVTGEVDPLFAGKGAEGAE
jgi:hypothetical protein